jgi:isoquinoline 1-oxidoreductase beta subunit
MRWSRRQVLWAGAAVGGGLIVASYLPELRGGRPAGPSAPPIGADGWLELGPDGSVRLYSNATEMGQGAWTALAQIVAEELEVDWACMRVEMAPVTATFSTDGSYVTQGSKTLRRLFEPMRNAAAAARTMLIAAAAARWQAPESECRAEGGAVRHDASGRTAPYGELAAMAATQGVPGAPSLKPRKLWRFIGQSAARIEGRSKVDGSAVYGIDCRTPDLAVAAIAQCPTPGGRLQRFDREAALRSAGVLQIVEADPSTLAVVARDFFSAERGLRTARPQWSGGEPTDSSRLLADLEAASRADGATILLAIPSEHEAARALESGASRVDGVYVAPFLLHAQPEPINATARVDASAAELWVSTQAQLRVRSDVAEALGLDVSSVTVHPTLVGGGFGRRLETDYAVAAARIARAVGRPVKAVWPRDEDSLQARLRPAAATRLTAALGADGRILALRSQTSCVDEDARVNGLREIPYAADARTVAYKWRTAAVRTGQWRSVDLSQNVFALESFVDECALAARADPLAYRRRLLAADPRSVRVLDELASQSSWRQARADGRFLGTAFLAAFGSRIAVAMEIAASSPEPPRVLHVDAVVDCGLAVNPRNVIAQIEGGLLFGLSAALGEQATIEGGAIRERNFDRYAVLRMAQCPSVNVKLLAGDDPSIGGVGELGVPVAAPALCNAVFAAQGIRVRRLPVLAALKDPDRA